MSNFSTNEIVPEFEMSHESVEKRWKTVSETLIHNGYKLPPGVMNNADARGTSAQERSTFEFKIK